MRLFDTHLHYDPAENGTPAEFAALLPAEHQFRLLVAGTSYESSCSARTFAHKVPHAYFTAGVHPHDGTAFDGDLRCFDEFRTDPKLLAVGEIGLDYFYDFSPREKQLPLLEQFLALALAWDKPAVVHLRDREGERTAYADALKRLERFAAMGGRFVVHCYSGNLEDMEKFLELGAYLGVTGMVTFRKAENIRALLHAMPPERMLLETDSPYLAPIPFRGKVNHPKYLVEIAKFVANELNMSPEALAEQCDRNGCEFFRIDDQSMTTMTKKQKTDLL